MKIANKARDITTGTTLTGGTVTVSLVDSATAIGNAQVEASGRWTFTENGQPGMVRQVYVNGNQTKTIDGDVYGQAGFWCEGELPEILQLFGDGVYGPAGTMPLSVAGMVVTAGTGLALVRGVLFPVYDPSRSTAKVTLDPASTANDRIDLVVIRLDRTAGSGRVAGRCALGKVTGTPAANPAAPGLTQTADVWEIEIGRVRVPKNAPSLSSANVSLENRAYASAPLLPDSINGSMIVDGAIGPEHLSASAVAYLSVNVRPGLYPNLWVSARQTCGGTINTAGSEMVAKQLVATPVFIPKSTAITAMALQVVQGGADLGKSVRFGVYATGAFGMPGALLMDAGTVGVGGQGIKIRDGLNLWINSPQWIWLAVLSDGKPGVETLINPAIDLFGVPNPSDNLIYCAVQAGVASAASMPNPFPAAALRDSAPLVWARTSGH